MCFNGTWDLLAKPRCTPGFMLTPAWRARQCVSTVRAHGSHEGYEIIRVVGLFSAPENVIRFEVVTGKLDQLPESNALAGLRVNVFIVSVLDRDSDWDFSIQLSNQRIAAAHLPGLA